MKTKNAENQLYVEAIEQELTEIGLSRRNLLKGMAVSAAGIAVAGMIPSNYVFADAESNSANGVTRGSFIAKISDYFEWPHPTEYNDIWKIKMKQFSDVNTTDLYGKQVETAYEEGIISGLGNKFNPNEQITRQDAADILVKAFHIPLTGKTGIFNDENAIDVNTRASVNTLVSLGYMAGESTKVFGPKKALTMTEMDTIFKKITSSMVAPVQALPKTNAVAPRRFIKLYCPTPGATIYYTTDGSEPTENSKKYNLLVDGHIAELVGSRSGESTSPDRDVTYKAIAVKEGYETSPVMTFTWHLNRPLTADYQNLQIMKKTATSPAVYRICNDSESVRAMAWYIEGPNSGIIFDTLQTSTSSDKNLKTYVDGLATKPYICIVGHEHGDHWAQSPNFLKAGIDVYMNERGWSSAITASPMGPALFTDAADQAKIKNIEEGMKFDLGGGITFDVYAMPGHANGLVVLHDKKNGLVFASDIYGCTRAGSADNVGIQGLRADLLLSFAQQVYAGYKKEGGKTDHLFTGHDETPLSDTNLRLFEKVFQQVIDNGEVGCSNTLRGNTDAPGSRTTIIGDMWKDATQWCAVKLIGTMFDTAEYLSSTTDLAKLPYMSDAANANINYNGGNNFMKYSVLSFVDITGGILVGKEVEWAPPVTFKWSGKEITVKNSLKNRFNPWAYDYTINVPKSNSSITLVPVTLSTRVSSITIDDKKVTYKSSNKIAVKDNQIITIKVTALDNITTSTYKFKIALV
nr:S-layer homology domain-containing protein [Sedimentibacter sp.]